MLDHHFLAICQFAVWDVVDLGVGVARRRHRALRCGDRIYLNLVSSYFYDYTCDQFLALFTKSSDRKSEKLHLPKICGTFRWRDKAS
ncbi:hypothetical protein [Nostoc sp.]|uniref:hypothetical protein n=1 Tax=Nostoc sp. TaxID=1180 RepID=UPI002FF909EB